MTSSKFIQSARPDAGFMTSSPAGKDAAEGAATKGRDAGPDGGVLMDGWVRIEHHRTGKSLKVNQFYHSLLFLSFDKHLSIQYVF